MATLHDLISADTQERFYSVQVFRSGNWIEIPVDAINASSQINRAGKMTLTITDDHDDQVRSQLYEGEKIRAFRGVTGAAPIRCWTGFVDTRQPNDVNTGLKRQIDVTDYIQELNTAIMLDGVVYDNLSPTIACIDAINRAIATQQWTPFDDNGNTITSTAGYDVGTCPIVYFPPLYNDDGSAFILPSGTLGSFTGTPATSGYATFTIPISSGTATPGLSYSAFELPNRYIIASTMVIPGFTLVSQTSFPPAVGQAILDAYNGILYFNSAQASTTCSFTATYFNSPLFDFPSGTTVADVITAVMDKTGCRWRVSGSGQLQYTSVDAIVAPSRFFNKDNYVSNGIQITRERRNVVVCLGWDGNCGGLLAAKAVNIDDINNAPPVGLGKRAYLIVQDQTWSTQYAVSKAVYYAVQQLSRRGKISTLTIMDDPNIMLDSVLCFESSVPEVGPGDLFYVTSIQWTASGDGSSTQSLMTLSGTLLPGQGTIYLGPISGVTATGGLDYTFDVKPTYSFVLSPAGGQYTSSFSITSGLSLTFTVGTRDIKEWIDIYGSDGSHIFAEVAVHRTADTMYTLPMPVGSMTAGVMYVIRHWAKDSVGNIGVFRTFITARP